MSNQEGFLGTQINKNATNPCLHLFP